MLWLQVAGRLVADVTYEAIKPIYSNSYYLVILTVYAAAVVTVENQKALYINVHQSLDIR